jgi:capsular exopolysaccharide synthesis family protein
MRKGRVIMNNSRTRNQGNDSRIILNELSSWSMKEGYKTIRTNVLASLEGDGCHVIGVSGITSEEGKNVNAVNLGIAIAQINDRVLVLDANLRDPQLGPLFHLQTGVGLSDILTGDAEFIRCLRHSAKHRIDVLPAGEPMEDSSEQLESPQMKQLIEELRKIYDYIIMILPPVTSVTDTSILSRLCDGMILTVRHRVTMLPMIVDALYQMDQVKANVIGFIYNGLEDER